jgi:hypothetical protein
LTEYPAIPVLKKIMGLNLQDGISGLACMIAFLYALVMTGIVVITFRKKDL